MAPGSFSWHVLRSLTDEVKTFQDGEALDDGAVFGISHDDETSELAAVTTSSSRGSSSRSNSEYADVVDMFRELQELTPRRTGVPSASATPSSNGACRLPTTSPDGSTGAVSPATIWCRSPGSAW